MSKQEEKDMVQGTTEQAAPVIGHPGTVDAAPIVDLIAKLEAANEPSRELDLAIHLALWPDDDLAKMTKHHRGLDRQEGYSWDIWQGSIVFEMRTADGRCPHNGGYPLPAFTSSLDDAFKLLRPHYLIELKRGIECRAIVWWLEKDWDDTGAPTAYSTTHLALAVTKAALLARVIEDRIAPGTPLAH